LESIRGDLKDFIRQFAEQSAAADPTLRAAPGPVHHEGEILKLLRRIAGK
jgi:hypothetical protein